MSNVAIITARGGSKRIPRKNIKNFCGKPIIAYSIEAALGSNCFDEVMVSTDDEEIASVAKQYGAEVPFIRSERTSNDYATTADVIEEVITNYQIKGRYFDIICCIYPTAPFITSEKLQKAMSMFRDKDVDSLIPVVKYSFPPQRAVIVRDNRVVYQYPEFAKARSQDLEPIYHDCGQFYLCKTEAFFENKGLVTKNTMPFIMSEMEVQDIDTEVDWMLAEQKYKMLYQGGE